MILDRLVLASLCVAGVMSISHSARAGTPAAESLVIRTSGRRTLTGPKDAPFRMPSDVAVGPNGTVYVLDGANNRVVVFAADGTFLKRFGTAGDGPGEFNLPLGIAAGRDSTIYVADSGNRRIQILTHEGAFIRSVSFGATLAGDVPPDPTDVAVAPGGDRLYVADNDNHRLFVYDLTRQAKTEVWGSAGRGPNQFRYPFLLDISSEGYLFVVEVINTRVQVMSPRGKHVSFLGNWGIRSGQLYRPKGVAVSGKRIFVTDSYLQSVQAFGVRGRFLGTLTDESGKPLALTAPTGIAADVKNNLLYIVELKANRVLCVRPEQS